jgi:hypothetical protein
VGGNKRVAVSTFRIIGGVAGVEVEAQRSRDELVDQIDVGGKLGEVAGFAGVVAGG